MKTFTASTLIACAALGFSFSGFAADKIDHNGMHAQTPVDSLLVNGLVKKVDKAAGSVTLTHGPLPNGMPGMTMAFKVKDAAWLDRMKAGQTIRFAADEVKGAMTVVRFESAK